LKTVLNGTLQIPIGTAVTKNSAASCRGRVCGGWGRDIGCRLMKRRLRGCQSVPRKKVEQVFNLFIQSALTPGPYEQVKNLFHFPHSKFRVPMSERRCMPSKLTLWLSA
jgi:hypothetical protein